MRRPIIGEVSDDGATPRPRRRARARRVLGQKSLESQGDETAERVRRLVASTARRGFEVQRTPV